MGTLAPYIQWLAAAVEQHEHDIFLTSAIVALLFALIMLLPRYDAFAVGAWVRYFGWAFACFAGQYALLWATWAFGLNAPGISFSLSFLSGANTFLFFTTAFYLLDRPRWWLWPTSGIIVVVSLLSGLIKGGWYDGLPNAMLSSICFGVVNYSLFINLRFRRSRYLAVIGFVVASVYSAVVVIYAFNPILVKLAWVESLVTQSDSRVKLNQLDDVVFIVALTLKLSLFLPGYDLLTRFLSASNMFRKSIRFHIERRSPYLSPQGVIKTIYYSLQADEVTLFIKLPGRQQERFAVFSWPPMEQTGKEDKNIAKIIDRSQLNAEVARALDTKAIIRSSADFPPPPYQQALFKSVSEISTSVIAPIYMHGAAIGFLRAGIRAKDAFAHSAHQQMGFFAEMLATIANSYRELASLDQANYRCARLSAEQPDHNSQWIVQEVTKILHDILSPMGTGLLMDLGFMTHSASQCENIGYRTRVEAGLVRRDLLEQEEGVAEKEGYFESPLSAAQDIIIGKLILLTQRHADHYSHPSLGTYFLHRKAICNTAASTILRLTQDYLNLLLKDFSLAVGNDTMTPVGWFEAVAKTARQAELLWAVVTPADQPEMKQTETFGAETSLIASLYKKPTVGVTPKLGYHRLETPFRETSHVLVLHLQDAKQLLYLGVGSENFGPELEFESPWKNFLEHFTEFADAALFRIQEATAFRQLQVAAANDQALATVAVTTGTLVHQLVNMVRDQLSATHTLSDAFHYGELTDKEGTWGQLVSSMTASALRMFELTQSITNVTKMDGRRPCRLLDAAHHAETLFRISLEKYQIKLEIDVALYCFVDVPFHVVALALANLVSNAIDAIRSSPLSISGRLIRITAHVEPLFIVCQVTDTGPGVQNELIDRLFDLGITTKPNGGGWGLYLTKRSLRENGCTIELSESEPGRTVFSLNLPKSK